MPRLRGFGRGDLHVRIVVETPQGLSEEERALFQRLAELEKVKADRMGRGRRFFKRIRDKVWEGS
jgi:molecular chaperone DnaJ